LTVGNIEQICAVSTAHWRTSIGIKVAICNYTDMAKPVDRLDALRGAIAVAEANDKLLHKLDFSGLEMDTIRKDWKGLRFAECNLRGACFSGCEMGSNTFIECDLTGCWMPASESTGIAFINNIHGA